MKNKGFTLVELLGVTVVLAIIALIAVPTIIGVIDKSRKGALQNSGYGLVEAGTLYYAEKQNTKTIRFDIKDNEVISEEENKLTYKGNIKEGTVLINNRGEVTVCINDGKYAAYKNFKDNKVTIVDNKTCNIPENSNIVYLDNEATIDMDLGQLLSKMENMEEQIQSLKSELGTLKEEKANQADITTSINNLKSQHNTDITSTNNRLDSLISNLDNTVSDTMMGKIHSISETITFEASTTKAYTGLSVTIPANSYYCLTGRVTWNYSVPTMVSINYTSTGASNITAENIVSGKDALISTTACGKVDNATTYYLWAKYDAAGSNYGSFIGFYIN